MEKGKERKGRRERSGKQATFGSPLIELGLGNGKSTLTNQGAVAIPWGAFAKGLTWDSCLPSSPPHLGDDHTSRSHPSMSALRVDRC